MRLPKVEQERAQHRMDQLARCFNRGDMAVLQRRQRGAHYEVERGQIERPIERTSKLKGSSQPIAIDPNVAATSPAINTTYLMVCQRL